MASAKLATRLLLSSNVALRSAATRHVSTSEALRAGGHGAADTDGVAPQLPTGIQYAEEAKQLGHSRHKQDFKDYKCSEYLHFNQLSYYDVEEAMVKLRCPQPSNKRPDTEPKVKA